MRITATVVSFNTRDLLLDCLAHLYASELDGHELEVVVVDNDSRDGSADAVAEAFGQVILIRSEVNLGFAAGQNLAMTHATGDAILVLNSDVLVAPDTVAALAQALIDRPASVGAVGPRVVNADGALAPSGRRVRRSMPSIMLAEAHRVTPMPGWSTLSVALRRAPGAHRLHDNFRPDGEESLSVGYVDGMAVMFRREALSRAGLFDEQFFFDCEILDLAIRLADVGYTQELVPTTTVVHIGGASRDQLGTVALLTNESKLRFYAKHYPQYFPRLRLWLITLLRLRLANPRLGESDRAALKSMLAKANAINRSELAIQDEKVPQISAEPPA